MMVRGKLPVMIAVPATYKFPGWSPYKYFQRAQPPLHKDLGPSRCYERCQAEPALIASLSQERKDRDHPAWGLGEAQAHISPRVACRHLCLASWAQEKDGLRAWTFALSRDRCCEVLVDTTTGVHVLKLWGPLTQGSEPGRTWGHGAAASTDLPLATLSMN
jgi:hypothetical protein